MINGSADDSSPRRKYWGVEGQSCEEVRSDARSSGTAYVGCCSTASPANPHQPLECEEGFAEPDDDATLAWGRTAPPTAPRLRAAGAEGESEILTEIRNALARGSELKASKPSKVSRSARASAAGWIIQVASVAKPLQPSTVFLAVALFDSFMSQTQVAPPQTMYQLVALACMFLATKQHESQQEQARHPASEWVQLALSAETHQPLYSTQDMQTMEWLVLETLEWRLQLPTAYTFLHHFLHALRLLGPDAHAVQLQGNGSVLLGNRSASAAPSTADDSGYEALAGPAQYMVELSLLFDDFLCYSYSTVAVAALVLAERLVAGGAGSIGSSSTSSRAGVAAVLQGLIPTLDLTGLSPCVEALDVMYAKAVAVPLEQYHLLPEGDDARYMGPVTARHTPLAQRLPQ